MYGAVRDVTTVLESVIWISLDKLINTVIDHFENEIITWFENDIRPGVLQPCVQQTCTLQKFHTKRKGLTYNQWRVGLAFDILAAFELVKCWTGAF